MKKRLLWPVVLAVVFCIGTVAAGFAQTDGDWEEQFVQALKKGKEAAGTQTDGLAYTPSEETLFQEAVKRPWTRMPRPASA